MVARRPHLLLEALEERANPSLFGVPWPDGTRLTLSFAPDTTATGAGPSDLFDLLNANQPTADWQREVLRAFQSWVRVANLNIGVAGDGGQPLGSPGAPQGDAQFGDIRLAAYPMSPEVVAIASPFNPLAGTFSGDVKLNSFHSFGPDGDYDLSGVLLHEAGHVFGLDHSADTGSPLFEDYRSGGRSLTPADVANIQALYGPREADEFDAKQANDSLGSATRLPKDGAWADLTTSADVDWYRIDGGRDPITLRLRTAGISLLAAQANVYDQDGRLVASATSNGVPGTDLELTLPGGRGALTYYLEVTDSGGEPFDVGAYLVQVVEPGSGDAGSHGPPRDAAEEPNQPVVNLLQKINRTDNRFDYVYRASLGDAADVDLYRFKAPTGNRAAGSVMTAMVWATQPGSCVRPRLTLLKENVAVPTEVLVNQDGTFVFQLRDSSSAGTYILAVESDAAGNPGEYFLGIDFSDDAVDLETLATSETPPAGAMVAEGTLHVLDSQLFHLVLSAGAGGAGDTVSITVHDSAGNLVLSLAAAANETRTATVVLHSGSYRFDVAGTGEPLAYVLRGLGITNPIGPEHLDATRQAVPPPPPGRAGSAAYWWQGGVHAFLGLVPPSTTGSPSSGSSSSASSSTHSSTPPVAGTAPVPAASQGGPVFLQQSSAVPSLSDAQATALVALSGMGQVVRSALPLSFSAASLLAAVGAALREQAVSLNGGALESIDSTTPSESPLIRASAPAPSWRGENGLYGGGAAEAIVPAVAPASETPPAPSPAGSEGPGEAVPPPPDDADRLTALDSVLPIAFVVDPAVSLEQGDSQPRAKTTRSLQIVEIACFAAALSALLCAPWVSRKVASS